MTGSGTITVDDTLTTSVKSATNNTVFYSGDLITGLSVWSVVSLSGPRQRTEWCRCHLRNSRC